MWSILFLRVIKFFSQQRQQDGAKEKYFFGHPVTVQVKKRCCNHLTSAPTLSTLSTNIMVIISCSEDAKRACVKQQRQRPTRNQSGEPVEHLGKANAQVSKAVEAIEKVEKQSQRAPFSELIKARETSIEQLGEKAKTLVNHSVHTDHLDHNQ